MAKRRTGKRRKPTKPDKPGPRLVAPGGGDRGGGPPVDVVELERARFEARKNQAIAKATIDLDHVDGEILKLLLLYPAITQEQIANLLIDGAGRSYTRQAVNERINAAKFQRALEQARRPALEIFTTNQAAAARRLGELLHSKDERIAVRAAIAHLWEFIHRDGPGGGSQDFVSFLQEAFEKAEAEKSAKAEA